MQQNVKDAMNAQSGAKNPLARTLLRKRFIFAALALAVALLGWRWQSPRLSEVERKLVGKWEETDNLWVFRSSGTASIEWVPNDSWFRQGKRGGLGASIKDPIDCDWRIEGNTLILKEHYLPLSANSPVLARLQHWLNHRRKPTIHRLPILLRTGQEIVLKKWTGRELHENNVTLQPVGSSWPSPTQRMMYAAHSKLREDRRAAQWGKRSPPL